MRRRSSKTKDYSLEDVGRLVNIGDWRKARWIVREPIFELRHKDTYHYWFLRALAELLGGDQFGATGCCRRRARTCADYRVWVEGDFLRDLAFSFIRKRQFNTAFQYLDEAERYHIGTNRRAVFVMAYGRLFYEMDLIEEALTCFKEADELWRQLKTQWHPLMPLEEAADDQWIANNKFHRLKAQAKAGQIDKKIAREVINDDLSRKRRWRARLITYFGAAGNKIDDWIAHSLSQ